VIPLNNSSMIARSSVVESEQFHDFASSIYTQLDLVSRLQQLLLGRMEKTKRRM